jgi:hypothetical protein
VAEETLGGRIIDAAMTWRVSGVWIGVEWEEEKRADGQIDAEKVSTRFVSGVIRTHQASDSTQ